MKIQVASLLLLASSSSSTMMAAAFAPPASSSRRTTTTSSSSTSRPTRLSVVPSVVDVVVPSFHLVHDLPAHIDSIHRVLSFSSSSSSIALADLDADAIADAAAIAASSSSVVAPTTTAVADPGNGWFGFLTLPIEYLLQLIHSALATMGVSSNAWGVSIIAMTVVIKGLTFPLTRSQLESTNKMQVRRGRACARARVCIVCVCGMRSSSRGCRTGIL